MKQTMPTHTALPKRSLFIASFSTIVEWYDFTLYLYFATVISRVFFGDNPKSLLITLTGFAVSYLMRPLGAVFFGHLGDKFGRKPVLLTTMTMMSVAMFITALLPTFNEIGIWSGVIMLLLRCIMAFSVGGEYTSVVAYLMEGAKPTNRGFIASLASAFSEIGGLLAVLVSALTVHFLGDNLLTWGWRIPFIVGGIMAMTVFVARHTMAESPEFLAYLEAKTPKKSPILTTFSQHKPAILKTFAISALGSITYYVGITFVPVFLTNTASFSEKTALWLSSIASFSVIIITPMIGVLSDKIGRKPVLIGACVLSAILPILLFQIMPLNTTAALIGSVILACMAGAVSAVATSATSEQFPINVRLSGLALGVTSATAIFGGLTPLLAQVFTEITGKSYASGVMIMVVAVCVLPVFLTLKETAPKFQPNHNA
ncbi:major facilitator superfamily protein [Moraxella macacae 0408225]|uniref:Major facilitator superfamily protein n=1 Tax=Moraxella macacae 0408225 TaxID=1230338 RepID=L2F7P5_9GAMM|nr:MFS transporter [Moraxella macacae]ELA08935.1 major facilitator superfamily protein [Moraxella macacae 0408225]